MGNRALRRKVSLLLRERNANRKLYRGRSNKHKTSAYTLHHAINVLSVNAGAPLLGADNAPHVVKRVELNAPCKRDCRGYRMSVDDFDIFTEDGYVFCTCCDHLSRWYAR